MTMKRQLDILLRIIGALALLFVAIVLFNRCLGAVDSLPPVKLHLPEAKSAGYEFTPRKVLGWGLFAIAGAAHGYTDAYHADPNVFERRWGADDYGFFGSNAWERNYKGNRYQAPDGSTNPHKPQIGNTFRDVWHFGNMTQKTFLIGGTFTLATSKGQKLKHKLLDVAIGMAAYSIAAHEAYNIRYK